MSVKGWWEERKRLQEDRDAQRYAEDTDDVWEEDADAASDDVPAPTVEGEPEPEPEVQDEPEPGLGPEPVAEAPVDEPAFDDEPEPEPAFEDGPAFEDEPEGDAEPEPAFEDEPEPEPQRDPGSVEAPAPEDPAITDGGVPQVYGESWWKRRLLGASAARPAVTGESVAEPDPVAEDEPEPVIEEEPAAVEEPDPEPVAFEPEPAEFEPEPAAFEDEPVALEDEPVALEDAPVALDDEAIVLDEEPVAEAPDLLEAEQDFSYLDDEDELYDDEPEVHPVVDEDASATPVGTDVPGPRRVRLEGERRDKRRKELTRGVIAAAVAAAVGMAGIVSILSRDDAPAPPAGIEAKGAGVKDTITTTLVFGTKEQRPEAGPTWMALLSVDTATGRCAVIYVPAHTATGVPGRGLLAVGDALESGGVPLLLLAAETLLGTPIDRYLELSDADAAVLFEEIGPLTVDVPAEVRVSAGPGQARLVFGEGPQRLVPEFLVELLYVKGLDTDDVELGARHLAFWSSLFEAFTFDAEGLGAAVKSSGAAVGESDASPEELARMFEWIAGADPEDRRLSLLPVRQVGVGGSELYQVDAREVEDFLGDAIGGQAVAGPEIRIQILNGNGAPGVGQHVAERLGDQGFRVILSGNARRLNYRETLVIAYDRSPEAIDLAEKTRDLIGVGEVQVAAQSQGIVDLTIVVGKDFLQTL